jgi:signal transduction histidine kinase
MSQSGEVQSLTSTQATPLHRSVSLAISIILILACIAAYPYSTNIGLSAPAFAVIFTTLTVTAALLTAYLLFGQFLGTGTPALAVLGGTYLYVGLINISYLLTLPRIFAIHALIDAGESAPSWLWILWQIGYPLGILLYVVIDTRYRHREFPARVNKCILFLLPITVILLVVLLTYIAIDRHHLLPNIEVEGPDGAQSLILGVFTRQVVFGLNALMCIGALLLLHQRQGLHLRFHGSILHLWLRTSTVASLVNVTFSVVHAGGRYSIGWYVARANGLMTAIFVLCALLYEVNKLYNRLVQQNKELAKQNRLQSDFLSVVGHEFRTALTGILGFSELIRTEELDSGEVRSYAEDIHSDASRMTRLINDLLDLERMKSGRMVLNISSVEINPLLCEVIRRICPVGQICRFSVELEPNLPPLLGDRDKLIQVFTNLLSNALKYSTENDPIVLTGKREGQMLHIAVRDCGVGIPREQLEIIFERYARVESTMNRHIAGTGLGLPIVRQIVTMHNGRVWAESAPGEGATFHVLLPLPSGKEETCLPPAQQAASRLEKEPLS